VARAYSTSWRRNYARGVARAYSTSWRRNYARGVARVYSTSSRVGRPHVAGTPGNYALGVARVYNARKSGRGQLVQVHREPNMIIGACEWVALPELGITGLRARTDTGAKSCALHASRIERFSDNGVNRVRFRVHASHAHPDLWQLCEADLRGVRVVRSSSGQHQERYTICTDLIIGHNRWSVDITLTNRAKMRYRMLLGRAAMKDHALVYPARTFLQGKPRLDSENF